MFKSYKIASKIWQIEYDKSRASEVLIDRLKLYPNPKSIEEEPDIIVKILDSKKFDENNFQILAINPGNHIETKNGFIFFYKRTKIAWERINKKIHILVYFNNEKNVITKLNNIQFHYPYQRFGQIFHEQVICPTVLMFCNDTILMHGSGVSKNNKGNIFTGTGGSGKTSIALNLILKEKYNFLADDICFLNTNGKLYSNLEFPKIYNYNIKQNKFLKKIVFKGKNIIDRLQWIIKQHIPPKSVRRSINPKILFDNRIIDFVDLDKIFVLFRCNSEKMSVNQITNNELSIITYDIIKSEYSNLFQHIYWHNVNSVLLNKESIISEKRIEDKYKDFFIKDCNIPEKIVIRIPLQKKFIKHDELGKYL